MSGEAVISLCRSNSGLVVKSRSCDTAYPGTRVIGGSMNGIPKKIDSATGGTDNALEEEKTKKHSSRSETQFAAAQYSINPNLLINPDFCINQRGKTEYETSAASPVYSVDRWRMGQGTVLVTETGLILQPGSVIIQLIEKKLNIGTTYTVSVCSKSGNAESASFVCKEDDAYIKLPSGINVKLSTNGIMIFNSTNSDQRLLWVKAEIGASATAFYPPDPAIELIKCQRYYEMIAISENCFVPAFQQPDALQKVHFSVQITPKRTVDYDVSTNIGKDTKAGRFSNASLTQTLSSVSVVAKSKSHIGLEGILPVSTSAPSPGWVNAFIIEADAEL